MLVIDGLEYFWGMVWLFNGDILIIEWLGWFCIVCDGVLDLEAIVGVVVVFMVFV